MNKKSIILVLFASFRICAAFLKLVDLHNREDLRRCYEHTVDNRFTAVNGQVLPLPNSLETFVSLMEKYESNHPDMLAMVLIPKLFKAFRVEGVPPNLLNWGTVSQMFNNLERKFFNIPENIGSEFKEEDFFADEICALHFMLSHSVNDTVLENSEDELLKDGVTMHPRESGIVSLYAKKKHAFALDKVLLGILAGLLGNNQISTATICNTGNCFKNASVNRLNAVTLGGLVSFYIFKEWKSNTELSFQPNGEWNDASCTTRYTLDENKAQYTTNSYIRGAIDGLIIGKKIEGKPQFFKTMRLSQILRMYYGPTGLIDDDDLKISGRGFTHWCNRDGLLLNIQNFRDETLEFLNLYTNMSNSVIGPNAHTNIEYVLNSIRASSPIIMNIKDEASNECSSTSDSNLDKKCTTPFNVFSILDMTTTEQLKDFQIEVIGNLSVNFDIRPNGNMLGVYTNTRPQQSGEGLNLVANNTGISGCQACFIRYKEVRSMSRMSEIEVFEKLNQTLTKFAEKDDDDERLLNEPKAGSPAKIILYFNYQNQVNDDEKLKVALREIKYYFREVTILAVGAKKDSLKLFTANYDADTFTESTNAADFVPKLKARICKVPAEFQFKECDHSNPSTETANKQSGFISVNKKQYWAMYPKYFLKSFHIYLKFKAVDGAKIKVCFSRLYYRIMEDNSQYNECYESSGDDIKFRTSNPCHRRDVHNCDPFYFSVEGKQAPNTACESIQCNSPKDIQFEFEHEGISCNAANFISVSMMTLVLACLLFILQRN